MGTNSWLATWMDAKMLLDAGTPIAPALVPGAASLPGRTGADVARELHGRPLVRFLLAKDTTRFNKGSDAETYVTPTPYTPEEAVRYLVLPGKPTPRRSALLLNPELIDEIIGPMWVATGRGIQYILPKGFPEEAIIVPGAPTGHWAIPVT